MNKKKRYDDQYYYHQFCTWSNYSLSCREVFAFLSLFQTSKTFSYVFHFHMQFIQKTFWENNFRKKNFLKKKKNQKKLFIKTQWKVVSDFTGKKGTFLPPLFFRIFWKIFRNFFSMKLPVKNFRKFLIVNFRPLQNFFTAEFIAKQFRKFFTDNFIEKSFENF